MLNESERVSIELADAWAVVNNNTQIKNDNCGKMYLLNMWLFDNLDRNLYLIYMNKSTSKKYFQVLTKKAGT